MTNRRKFYFDTGVRPWIHTSPVPVMPGNVVRGGTLQIPFECDDVPDGAIFVFACDHAPPGHEDLLMREMHNTRMVSKFAFFQPPLNP